MKIQARVFAIRSIIALQFIFWAAQVVGAQAKTGKASAPSLGEHAAPVEDPVPHLELQFKMGDPVPGLTASPVMLGPAHCNVDGAALLDMLAPPEFKSRMLYLATARKSTAISLKSIPNYPDGAFLTPTPRGVQIIDTFATHSQVAVLLTAAKIQEGSTRTNEWHQFIARFDNDGTFQDTIELPISYQLFRLAVLTSGEFLVFGFDASNGVPRLVLVDSDGTPKRSLSLPQNIEEEVRKQSKNTEYGQFPRTTSDAFLGSKVFSGVSFSTYGDKVILWQKGKNSLIEVGEHGNMREVQLQSPHGYRIQQFIPSNDSWMILYSEGDQLGGGSTDPGSNGGGYVLYEVNPSDGGLRRRFDLGRAEQFWVACEHDRALTTFKTDSQQHLIPLIADLPR